MVKYMVTLNSSTGVGEVKQCCAPTATINIGNFPRLNTIPKTIKPFFPVFTQQDVGLSWKLEKYMHASTDV